MQLFHVAALVKDLPYEDAQGALGNGMPSGKSRQGLGKTVRVYETLNWDSSSVSQSLSNRLPHPKMAWAFWREGY